MKRALVLLIACCASMFLSAQQLHWTPVSEGLYSGSTTVIAVVQINGVEQSSTQMELAAFSGEECRGTAFTTEFPITHRFLAMVNVYGEIGHELTFKVYNHATDEELEMNPAVTVIFTEDGSGTLFEPLELNFRLPIVVENMVFADANVKALCVANWDTNGDGELSYAEAAAVTDLGEVFRSNYSITTFDELQYFTGLSSIGENAFVHCLNLTSVVLPNTITELKYQAFYDCRSLLSITIPASVTNIAYSALSSDDLETIVVEAGNMVYDSRDNCNAVIITSSNELLKGCKNTVIPNTVVSISQNAFSHCTMETITIPASIAYIGYGAFHDCENLSVIIVSTENNVYDSRNNCNAIIETSTNKLIAGSKTTVIPNTVTAIDDYAFSYRFVDGSYNLTIPESILSIGHDAFLGGYAIDTITVLAQVPPTLGSDAFEYVPKDIPVFVPYGTVAAYQAASGWNEFTNIQENMEEAIVFADANVKALCVANWDTNGDGELSYAEAAAVTDLGEVFKGSAISSFEELQYFTELTEIGDYAFYHCYDLFSITIPNTINSIESYAFYNCSSLASITIPDSVSYIDKDSFTNCDGLSQINVGSGNMVYDSRDNCNAIVKTDNNVLVRGCKNTIIPNTVTSIGEGAFWGCVSLTEINIPSSVTSFSSYAFAGCSNLTYIEIPNSVTSICSFAFGSCSNLTSVEIPASVTNIGHNPFDNCIMLAEIVVAAGNTVYDSRENCNAIIETNTNTVKTGCKNTIIPNTVNYIGYCSFDGCSGLISVEIPNSVVYIGSQAFMNCSGLVSLVIGNSVNSIESFAFSRCNSLENIIVRAETPPTVASNYAFYNVDKSITVYVPCGTVETYQAASGWSEFTNYQELECPSYVITATANPIVGGTITGAGTYVQDETCTLTATANAGYAFVNWTEGGTVVSTEATYTFTMTGERTLVANFEMTGPITLHWTPIQNFENTMDGIGVVLVDGVEQQSAGLELGIFCDDECRGAVLPEEESGHWFYYFTMGGNQGESFSFRLYDHAANQELDLVCNETIPFEINGFIGDFEDPHEFLFSNNVTIAVQVNPDGAGVVTGTGDWPLGSSVTLTATANEGFAFLNWTIGDEVVSTDTSLTITAEASMDIVANFNYVQSWSLQTGWTWWSTYIELSNITGLSMLEEALGDAGVMIKTKNAYARVNANHTWYGSLKSINNETGYKIQTSAACDIDMTGTLATSGDHPITIGNGWNWIGYPVMTTQSPNAALTGFQPENKDVIKGQSGYARYDSNSGTWKPASFTLVPGRSYLYYSNATESKSMTFVTGRNERSVETEECHWTGDVHAFPDNNCILAIVKVDGVEQRDNALELGAFVDGQCRGSVRLMHDDDYDRYFAMLTVTAQDGEEIHFGVFDHQSGEASMNCATRMTFESDAIIGDFTSPFEINLTTRRNENANMSVYPNPMDRNQLFSIQLPDGEQATGVTITDATGALVRCEMGGINVTMIDGFQTAGVYVVRVTCTSGNVYYHKLVVK